MKTFLFSLLFSTTIFAQGSCQLESFTHIFKINKVTDDSIIKNSSCSKPINEEFTNLVSNANGKLNSKYLNRYFKSEYNTHVELSPTAINVREMKDILEEKFGTNTKSISKVTSLHGKSSYNLDSLKNFEIKCSQCSSTGNKSIQLISQNNTTWISASVLIKTTAFKVTRSLSRISPLLLAKDFQKITTTDKGRVKYFTDIENIQFYTLNKDLGEGDLIKSHDLSPKNLVRYGQKIKLTIKSKHINLKTIGIAKKTGRIGDFIEIQNPKTKKVFLGKITDFNNATVEI